jgi:hypothetical protein
LSWPCGCGANVVLRGGTETDKKLVFNDFGKAAVILNLKSFFGSEVLDIKRAINFD